MTTDYEVVERPDGLEFSQKLTIGERLTSLTYEQVVLIDLLSQGYKRSEVATEREAQTPEITALTADTLNRLGVKSNHGAAYLLLSEGYLTVGDGEREAARGKIASLTERQQDMISTIMNDLSYEAAGDALDLNSSTLKQYFTKINAALDSSSLMQTVRIGFAAGLKPSEAKHQPETGQVVQVEQKPVSRDNLLSFVSWMYPREKIDRYELTDDDIRATAQIILDASKQLMKDLDGKTARRVRSSVQNLQAWLEGQTIAHIAMSQGKTDGSISISLSSWANRLAPLFDELEGLIEETKSRAEKNASVAWQVGILATAGSEDMLAPGEKTVKDVILNIKSELKHRKVTSSDEPYEKPLVPPETFEAELVTLFNALREPLHISRIVQLFGGGAFAPAEIYNQVYEVLSKLEAAGEIESQEGGYFGTWSSEDEEPQPAAEPAQLQPDTEVRLRQPTKTYDKVTERYLHPLTDKSAALQNMLEDAGISDDGQSGRRGRRRSRSR